MPKHSIRIIAITLLFSVSFLFRFNAYAAGEGASSSYSDEQIKSMASELYSGVQDSLKQKMYVSSVLNSVFYDPDNVTADGDTHMVILYRGEASQIDAVNSYLHEGEIFFSSIYHYIITSSKGWLEYGIEADLTPEKAMENRDNLVHIYETVQTIKNETSQMDDTSKAQYICDYIANNTAYDSTLNNNCLVNAIVDHSSACVGYNAQAMLLFTNCGIPYETLRGDSRINGVGHVFGRALINGSWQVFDVTNYDQDEDGTDSYFIFSDEAKEGKYYMNIEAL